MENFSPIAGVYIYKNAMPNAIDVPERLEKLLGNNDHEIFKWNETNVGFMQRDTYNRNCLDHKVNKLTFKMMDDSKKDLETLWKETQEAILKCLNHYLTIYHNIPPIDYMESINYIKYEKDTYFKPHVDHGPSYTAVMSSVVYFNDNYEGGELKFKYFDDYMYKPSAGDIIIFPSSFLYLHESVNITSGTKYSAVTMFDYNDLNHRIQITPRIPAAKNY